MGRRTRIAALAIGVAITVVPGGAAQARSAPEADPITPALVPKLDNAKLLPSTGELMSTVRDLVDLGPRETGTPGGRRAADYVARRFRAAGLSNVHFETAPSFSWKASDFSLSVGGRRIPTTPIQHSMIKNATDPSHRTLGKKGRTAQIVDIGSSGVVPSDAKGKIVMFDLKFQLPLAALGAVMEFLYDPQGQIVDPEALLTANPYLTSFTSTMQAIQDAGAVGAIGVLADYFNSHRYRNEYYRRFQMTLPGFWITKKQGVKIRAGLTDSTTATMRLTTDRKRAIGRTVVGFLPGQTNDTIMVHSHHDSQGPGAVEDGTGSAEVIGLADYYGALAKQPGYTKPEKTLMFITFDTHFTGYQQHMAFVTKYLLEKKTKYNIVADTVIEHIGKQAKIGANGKLEVLDQPEPSGIFENLNPVLKAQLAGILVQNDLAATAVLNATPFQLVGVPTDASFTLIAGVPIASLIAGPMYMYDDADTIDKVDRSRMRPMAMAYAQLIGLIDATPSDQIGITPPPVAGALTDAYLAVLG